MSWRNTREYRIWRAHVIRRDRRCMCCNATKPRHAHHIEHASYAPEKRFDVDNGITLCRQCHMILHTKFAGSYRKKCTPKHLRDLLFVRRAFAGECQLDNHHHPI